MKKFVFMAIIIEGLVIWISFILYLEFYSDENLSYCIDMIKIIISATLSGIITFCGLFFTIWSQDHQNTIKEKEKYCPYFIVKESKNLSAEREMRHLSLSPETIICTKDNIIRIIECTICNSRNNYGINVFIESNEEMICIGNKKDEDFKLTLAIKNSDSFLCFYFEDIYGVKYKQKITYSYSKRPKGRVYFISCQPERIRKNVFQHK